MASLSGSGAIRMGLPLRAGGERRAALGGLGRLRRFIGSSLTGAASLCVLLLVATSAIFADALAPYHPLATDYTSIGRPPSVEHLLGTDLLGRDVLSRLIYGARVTLVVAFSSVLVGDSLGFVWGLVSGCLGRRFDVVSQRFLDVLIAFPVLILAMLLVVSFGSGLQTVIIAIAITRVPLATRVIRSVVLATVLATKELAYVDAARGLGATPGRLMRRHLAPQCVAPLLVIASFNLGTAIFAEAALSFLGVGVPPPTPTWARMLGGVLAEASRPPWWLVVFPGLAITVTIVAANLLGDALRDFLDPRLKRQVE